MRPDIRWRDRTICDPQERYLRGSRRKKNFSTSHGRRSLRSAFTSLRRPAIIFPTDFIASYRGVLILLMQKHLEFQIVTPRTLANFRGDTLILPDVRLMKEAGKILAAHMWRPATGC